MKQLASRLNFSPSNFPAYDVTRRIGYSRYSVSRRVLVVAIGLFAAGINVSHAQSKVGTAEILLGQTIDISGPGAELGKEVVQGMNLYFDSVNANGGINNRKIKLQTLNDAYDVEKAATNVRRLLEAPNLVALLTPLGTATTLRVSKEAGDMPVLFPLTGTAGIRGAATPNTYYLRASYADEVQRIVDHSRTLGLNRLAIIHSEDGFGKPGLIAFEKALAAYQLKPHAIGTTADFNSKSVTAAVRTVVESKPDAVLVYLPATFPDAVLALRQAGFAAPVYGISVAFTPGAMEQLGQYRRGLMFTQIVPPYTNRKFPLVREYLAHLEGKKLKPSFASLEGYLNAKVVSEALRRVSGEPNKEKLRRALEGMGTYDAGNFLFQLDRTTRSGSKFVQIGIIDRTGELLN